MRRIAILLPLLLPAVAFAPPRFQFAPSDRDRTMRQVAPQLPDLDLAEAMFWRDVAVPRVHQASGGAFDSRKVPNVNVRFPFDVTAGMHDCDRTSTGNVKFLILPKGEYVGVRAVDKRAAWTYPVGTVAGEVLWEFDSRGDSWAFEVRTRLRTKTKWLPNVYRPVLSVDELPEEFRPTTSRKASIEFEGVVNESGTLQKLPEMPEEFVRQLLARPFKKWTGRGDRFEADQAFGLVPKGYTGQLLNVDSDTCMRCHERTNRDGVRGSDGIFDLHPFHPSGVSRDGDVKPLLFRADLDAAGVFGWRPKLKGYFPIEGVR